jgi:hypothetical protein
LYISKNKCNSDQEKQNVLNIRAKYKKKYQKEVKRREKTIKKEKKKSKIF